MERDAAKVLGRTRPPSACAEISRACAEISRGKLCGQLNQELLYVVLVFALPQHLLVYHKHTTGAGTRMQARCLVRGPTWLGGHNFRLLEMYCKVLKKLFVPRHWTLIV